MSSPSRNTKTSRQKEIPRTSIIHRLRADLAIRDFLGRGPQVLRISISIMGRKAILIFPREGAIIIHLDASKKVHYTIKASFCDTINIHIHVK